MAEVRNIENLSKQQLAEMVKQGGKFVIFQYTISIVVMTFREHSNVYFIKPGEGSGKYSWGYTLLTSIMGWWGIPWGPIYSIGTLATNIGGGKDVTIEIGNQLGLYNHSGYNISGNNNAGSTANTNQSGSGGYNIPGNNTNTNPGQSSGGYNIPR